MTGTIDLEEVLKIAEGMHLQLKEAKVLPAAISELFGFPTEEGAINGVVNGETSRDSTPSTPDKSKLSMSIPVKSSTSPKSEQSGTSSGQSSKYTTPDDSSIEILAEHADPFL